MEVARDDFNIDTAVNETLRRLDPIINKKFKDHEDAVTAQIVAVRTEMRQESRLQAAIVQQHHVSNTLRLDTLANSGKATQAAVERVEVRVDKMSENVMELLGEVRSWAGKQLGITESDEKHNEEHKNRMTALKWLA